MSRVLPKKLIYHNQQQSASFLHKHVSDLGYNLRLFIQKPVVHRSLQRPSRIDQRCNIKYRVFQLQKDKYRVSPNSSYSVKTKITPTRQKLVSNEEAKRQMTSDFQIEPAIIQIHTLRCIVCYCSSLKGIWLNKKPKMCKSICPV
jgi:hypothetical protein